MFVALGASLVWAYSPLQPEAAAVVKTYVAQSSIKGADRGVFAARDIAPCEQIEDANSIELNENEYPHGVLSQYVFKGPSNSTWLVLGHGMLYNHLPDGKANVEYRISSPNSMVFYANRPIKANTELFIDCERASIRTAVPNRFFTMFDDCVCPQMGMSRRHSSTSTLRWAR